MPAIASDDMGAAAGADVSDATGLRGLGSTPPMQSAQE
jgi:hypothetical protein